jgi:hypothetical protein
VIIPYVLLAALIATVICLPDTVDPRGPKGQRAVIRALPLML